MLDTPAVLMARMLPCSRHRPINYSLKKMNMGLPLVNGLLLIGATGVNEGIYFSSNLQIWERFGSILRDNLIETLISQQ